jgi:hypothetical protein
VGESLKVHLTARLPGLGFSGREPEGIPTARLPGLRVSGPGSLDVHPTARLPGLRVSEREPEGTPYRQATRSGS